MMNSTYIKQNAPALKAKPSFSTIGTQARSSNQIVFDYGHGVPSNATHVHPSIFAPHEKQ